FAVNPRSIPRTKAYLWTDAEGIAASHKHSWKTKHEVTSQEEQYKPRFTLTLTNSAWNRRLPAARKKRGATWKRSVAGSVCVYNTFRDRVPEMMRDSWRHH
ncbi:MAG: hypothetical protein DWH94_07190, partial [Planctomycetota bacterium]